MEKGEIVTGGNISNSFGCRPGQVLEYNTWCRSSDGRIYPSAQCLQGETLTNGVCLPPASSSCVIGQAQIGVDCVTMPAQTIAIPVDACGFDISFAAALLIVKILQCK